MIKDKRTREELEAVKDKDWEFLGSYYYDNHDYSEGYYKSPYNDYYTWCNFNKRLTMLPEGHFKICMKWDNTFSTSEIEIDESEDWSDYRTEEQQMRAAEGMLTYIGYDYSSELDPAGPNTHLYYDKNKNLYIQSYRGPLINRSAYMTLDDHINRWSKEYTFVKNPKYWDNYKDEPQTEEVIARRYLVKDGYVGIWLDDYTAKDLKENYYKSIEELEEWFNIRGEFLVIQTKDMPKHFEGYEFVGFLYHSDGSLWTHCYQNQEGSMFETDIEGDELILEKSASNVIDLINFWKDTDCNFYPVKNGHEWTQPTKDASVEQSKPKPSQCNRVLATITDDREGIWNEPGHKYVARKLTEFRDEYKSKQREMVCEKSGCLLELRGLVKDFSMRQEGDNFKTEDQGEGTLTLYCPHCSGDE